MESIQLELIANQMANAVNYFFINYIGIKLAM